MPGFHRPCRRWRCRGRRNSRARAMLVASCDACGQLPSDRDTIGMLARGRGSGVLEPASGPRLVSKRASVSYGARVCRVMHADPETTNRFVSASTVRLSDVRKFRIEPSAVFLALIPVHALRSRQGSAPLRVDLVQSRGLRYELADHRHRTRRTYLEKVRSF